MDASELDYAIEIMDGFLWPNEDVKQRQKRERILHAATGSLSAFRVSQTSIDDVAKQAGVAKGTVYLYYRNKAELVYHAISLEERQYLERMRPLAEETLTPRERLISFLRICGNMIREMPLTSSLVQGDHEIAIAMQEVDKSFVANANSLQVDYVVHLLEDASLKPRSKSELRLQARILVDIYFSLSTSNLMNPEQLDWDTYVTALADLLVNGLIGTEAEALLSSGPQARRDPKKSKRVRV